MAFFKELTRNGLGAPLLVVMILAMMIVPMPTFLLDISFTFNIALSLIVLLVSIYSLRPLDFSSFPTVLLVATMLRLALNIASTRVVLMEGHTGTASAGAVIESFGEFVIGGNYAVGLVVFAILVIINFVVVTKGAGRVSEVSARFTLDAMPGKQMAIDADLNAGLINQTEARIRREEVSREADFYGSMDGASKFVRGDAIAGILILFINIVGGIAIGVGQHDLAFKVAVHNYTLLTIGDGLVAQLPSLLLSTAAAIIVTRVSSSQDMSDQIIKQMFTDPRALWITAIIIGLLGLIPGMPNVAFLLCAGGLAFMAKTMAPKEDDEPDVIIEPEKIKGDNSNAAQNVDLSWDDMKAIDIVGLEVGYRIIPLVDQTQGGQLMGRIKGVRRKLSQDLGFLVQPVHIRDNLDLSPNRYRITLMGIPEGEGDVYPDKELAINPGHVFGTIEGISTRDPSFGMPAFWIDPGQKDHAQTLGYTVVDAGTVIVTHLSKLLQEHAHELMGYQEVERLMENLAKTAPKLVEDLIPKALPMATVLRVLQNLLQEGIPIKNMRTIAETLAEHARNHSDADSLTAVVRVALRRLIMQQIAGMSDEIPVITLAPDLERLLQRAITQGPEGGVGIEPGLTERLHQNLSECVQRQEASGQPAILLVPPALRLWLAKLFHHAVPGLNVLSYTEMVEDKKIRVVSSIGGELTGQVANRIAAA
ncbi:MAG: flagellar biosynthesis protein FlhA [Gammaproteobacteria bacterium]|nr:flagellar biosynthesis protein FlhA [Gammaproteobacteria bacterium]